MCRAWLRLKASFRLDRTAVGKEAILARYRGARMTRPFQLQKRAGDSEATERNAYLVVGLKLSTGNGLRESSHRKRIGQIELRRVGLAER